MSENHPLASTYTPAQVSEMLGLPASSLRRYSVEYRDLLSGFAQAKGKKRRYTDADVQVIARIRELLREKKSPEEVRRLALIVEDPQPGSALALLPQIAAEFENLRTHLARMEQERQADREELQQLRDQVNQLHQELQAARIPWYKRFFKSGGE